MRRNPKPETRNPNETPNPKPQWGVRSSILGFPSGLSLRVEDWFWSFIRISGFALSGFSALRGAETVMHPSTPHNPPQNGSIVRALSLHENANPEDSARRPDKSDRRRQRRHRRDHRLPHRYARRN